MKDYLIFMDASGDVEKKCANDGGLKFIPMDFAFGDKTETYDCSIESDFEKDFYTRLRQKTDIKTTQIAPSFYEEYFEPYLKKGLSIVYLCLSSGLSSTYNSAILASKALKETYPDVSLIPVDTVSATCGMGLIAEKAIENKKNGLSAEDNAADLEITKFQVTMLGVVSDLMYLKRGGRIGASTAVVGTMLNIKPMINISSEGTLAVFDKKVGMKKSIKALVDVLKAKFDEEKNNTVYVCDTDDAQNAEILAGEIRLAYPNCVIKRKLLSPIIGAHLGPGALVLGFYQK